MLQKKNEGILFSAEIRVVGSYTDRLINFIFSPKILLITFAVNLSKNKLMMICPYKRTIN